VTASRLRRGSTERRSCPRTFARFVEPTWRPPMSYGGGRPKDAVARAHDAACRRIPQPLNQASISCAMNRFRAPACAGPGTSESAHERSGERCSAVVRRRRSEMAVHEMPSAFLSQSAAPVAQASARRYAAAWPVSGDVVRPAWLRGKDAPSETASRLSVGLAVRRRDLGRVSGLATSAR
jgi:hypothetical protein